MRKEVLALILILMISGIYAQCNETQININTASEEELDEIEHVGPKVASYIIDYRTNNKTFDSIDELVNIKYLSINYVTDIKEQGLACVSEEDLLNTNNEENTETEQTTSNEQQDEQTEQTTEINEDDAETEQSSSQTSATEATETNKNKEPLTFNTINLNPQNPKDIKTEDSKQRLEKGNYAFYGFIAFCVLLGILITLKKRKMPVTEFD